MTLSWVSIKSLLLRNVSGKPSQYVTKINVNFAFHFFGLGKSSISIWG